MFISQPDIPKYARPVNPNATPGAPQEKDYISYTVSAPSGRGTAIFSADGKLIGKMTHLKFAVKVKNSNN